MLESHHNRDMGPVFVGRQREMDELRTALDDAMAGRGRLIMLAGEPGIGKSRIAQELASTAEELGGQALWGRCHEGQGRPPYWPWIQIIRSYVRNCDPGKLAAELGSGAAAIAEVVAEIGEKISDLPKLPDLEPEQARFRLFDAVTGFLKNASGARPSLLIFEDLQWSDTPSLLMLEFLNAELLETPILLLGTYRDAELPRNIALSHTLGELARQQHFREFLLQGLSREDVTQFMAGAAGDDPSQELAKRVFLTTEGNPLFMTQIVQLLVHQGQMKPSGPVSDAMRDVEIPQSVRLAIRRRLSRLSEECLQILRLASVIGREFTLDQLAVLSETATEERILEVLAEPLTDRVIEELPRSVGRYQFTHALIQDTLAQELSPTRKVRLHAMIAQTLEVLYGDDIEVHAAELAYHYGEAEAVTGHHKTAHFASLAGEWALSAYAPDEALAHFKQALAGKEGQALDGETAKHLFGLARAQGATGQVDEAWATLGPAFDYYVKEGDVAMAVAVAEYPLFYVSGLKEATRFVTEALTLVPPDSLEAGRLLSRLGLLLNLDEGDYEGATEAFGRALTIAQREQDAPLEMRTLAAPADAEFYRLHWSAVLEKNVRVVGLAQRANDPLSEAWPHWLAAFSLLCLGRSEEAIAHAEIMLRLAERLHNRGLLASSWIMSALTAHTRGEWQAARDFHDRELSQEPGSFGFLAYRSLVEFEVGDFSQGRTRLERCLEIMRQGPPGPSLEWAYSAVVVPLAARITGGSDRLDAAAEAGQAVVGSPSAMSFSPSWPGPAWGCWRCCGTMPRPPGRTTPYCGNTKAPCLHPAPRWLTEF